MRLRPGTSEQWIRYTRRSSVRAFRAFVKLPDAEMAQVLRMLVTDGVNADTGRARAALDACVGLLTMSHVEFPRWAVVSTVERLGPAVGPLMTDLVGLVKHSDPRRRAGALSVLHWLFHSSLGGEGAEDYAEDLLPCLHDPDPEVVRQAVSLFLWSGRGTPGLDAELVAVLQESRDPEVLRDVAHMLLPCPGGVIHDAATELRGLFDHPSAEVRPAAQNALHDLVLRDEGAS